MNKHQKYLIEVYLDWVNDYLTYDVMCEHYGISRGTLQALIHEGERLYNIYSGLKHQYLLNKIEP